MNRLKQFFSRRSSESDGTFLKDDVYIPLVVRCNLMETRQLFLKDLDESMPALDTSDEKPNLPRWFPLNINECITEFRSQMMKETTQSNESSHSMENFQQAFRKHFMVVFNLERGLHSRMARLTPPIAMEPGYLGRCIHKFLWAIRKPFAYMDPSLRIPKNICWVQVALLYALLLEALPYYWQNVRYPKKKRFRKPLTHEKVQRDYIKGMEDTVAVCVYVTCCALGSAKSYPFDLFCINASPYKFRKHIKRLLPILHPQICNFIYSPNFVATCLAHINAGYQLI